LLLFYKNDTQTSKLCRNIKNHLQHLCLLLDEPIVYQGFMIDAVIKPLEKQSNIIFGKMKM